MYQRFYNLKDNPFRLTPDPAYLYLTGQYREALAGLVYSACTRSGLAILVGEAGTGKTTLLNSMIGLLEKRRFVTAVCTNPTLTRQEFFDFLLLSFRVECGSALKSRQLVSLREFLERQRSEGRQCILVVDEAQRLPLELLEEIRLLLNLETTREKLLQIVLAGQPELMDILHLPELRQFKQRISCVCKLNPLGQAELREYLPHRLARAGADQQGLFPEAVVERIYGYTQGIPRLVNSLCDSALQLGLALQAARISVAIIDEAAKDLDLQAPPRQELPVGNGIMPVQPRNGHLAASRKPALASDGSPGLTLNQNGSSQDNVPLESYSSRQRSLGYFSSWIERWK